MAADSQDQPPGVCEYGTTATPKDKIRLSDDGKHDRGKTRKRGCRQMLIKSINCARRQSYEPRAGGFEPSWARKYSSTCAGFDGRVVLFSTRHPIYWLIFLRLGTYQNPQLVVDGYAVLIAAPSILRKFTKNGLDRGSKPPGFRYLWIQPERDSPLPCQGSDLNWRKTLGGPLKFRHYVVCELVRR
jgi:hypothetical protein